MIALCPCYRALEGTMPSFNDLIERLEKFSCGDWLHQLARLATLLGESRIHDKKYARVFWGFFISPSRSKSMDEFFRTQRQNNTEVVPFPPRAIGILAELAILYAPSSAPKVMEFKEGEDSDEQTVFDAFLILWDLVGKGVNPSADEESRIQNAADMATRVQQSQISSFAEAARALRLYLHRSKAVQAQSRDLAKAFEESTGVSLVQYLMGGFGLLVHEQQKTISDLVERWEGIPTRPENFKFSGYPDAPVKACEAVQSYCRVRRGTLGEIRCAIEKYEPKCASNSKHMDPSGFNLIALHKYPLVDLEARGTRCLYYQGLSASLLHGVYHAAIDKWVSTYGKEGGSPQYINGLYGKIFEDYVLEVLERVVNGRLLKRPKTRSGKEREGADGIIEYANGIIVVEIKGWKYNGTSLYAFKTTEEFLEELEQSGLGKAIRQMERHVQRCLDNDIEGLRQFDWDCHYIQPVIVTDAYIPFFPGAGRLLNPKLNVFAKYPCVKAAQILHVTEVEMLPDIASKTGSSIWDVLKCYAADHPDRDIPFRNFLNELYDISYDYSTELVQQAIRDYGRWLGLRGTVWDHNS